MATIEGRISDGGNGIENALVTILDSATETTVGETRTDGDGDYSFTVDPDTYDVCAERIGYEDDEQTEVTVGTGETQTVDLTLPALQRKAIGRGSDLAVGVLGESTAGSGRPIGVQGSVDSTEGYGLHTPDDARIEGETAIGTTRPVTTLHVKDSVAEPGDDNLGRHVAAIENTSTSASPIPDVLGLGLTNVSGPGQFNSYISFIDDTGTIGAIQGDGDGGVEFTGSVRQASTRRTGLSVWDPLNDKIPADSPTTLQFRKTNADDFGGFDTSTGVYTIQEDGDYHVSFGIGWVSSFDSSTLIAHKLEINGDANTGQAIDSRFEAGSPAQDIAESHSRTLFGLSQGDTLNVTVFHNSDDSKLVSFEQQKTYLTLHKVG